MNDKLIFPQILWKEMVLKINLTVIVLSLCKENIGGFPQYASKETLPPTPPILKKY